MGVRKFAVSAVAAMMVVGGVGIAVAPTASAASCPTLSGSIPYTVSPAPSAGVDWSSCNLSEADLTGAKLSYAKLTGADLTGAKLSGARLISANLISARLVGTDLSGANLTGARLTGAYSLGAYLSDAILSDAILSGADLSGADLSGADLSGADLTMDYASQAANLTGANLTAADLSGANLNGATLNRATLIRANLTGAYLSGVAPSGVDLTGADLSSTYGILTDLRGARVTCSDTGVLGVGIRGDSWGLPSGWTLTGGTLTVPINPCSGGSQAPASAADCPTVDPVTGVVTPRLGPGLNYRGCSFVGANLNGVDLTDAQLGSTQWGQNSAVQAVLTRADLSEAVFLGPVDLTRANLTGANLEKADLAEGFVTAAGDTGELGCGITGKPRTLPPRWALANGCLKTKGASADQAPRPCPSVSTPATTPVPFQSGPHPLWAEGDISCAEAIAIVEDTTEDGTVNSRVLASQMVQALGKGESGELWVALSSTESLRVIAEPISGIANVVQTDAAINPGNSGGPQRTAPRFRTEVTYRQADETGRRTLIVHDVPIFIADAALYM